MPSTVIHSIKYDADALILTIRFVSGSLYEYTDVPQDLYEQFKQFREKGVFYNQHIKGKFRFSRIPDKE